MAQSHPTNPGNRAITVNQIVAALQQLGITLSNGAAPSAIMVSNPTTQNPASANTGPPATPVAPAAVAPPAAGVPTGDSNAPGNTFPSWFTSPRRATAATAATAAPASAAPPSSPTSGAEEATPSHEDAGKTGCLHVCSTCHAKQSGPSLSAAPAAKPAPTATSLFTCPDSWYVVIVGRAVGVFQGWLNVEPLVTGLSGFSCKRFPSREAAEAAFADALDHGLVKVK